METYDVIVVGAGQAGLAAGYHLRRAGVRFVMLEAGENPTGSWLRYYDSLKLFSPARYSSLPGFAFPGDPERYPARDEVVDYLRRYAAHFDLPILTNMLVEKVEREGAGFRLTTSTGAAFAARCVIAATGAFSRPHLPLFEGQDGYTGAILHSSAYLNPQPFVGKRVLVIGAGNSAVQIAVELAGVTTVTLTSREPVRFRRQRILGRDVHFWIRVTGFDTWRRPFPAWSPMASSSQAGVLDSGVYRAGFASGNPAYQPLFKRFTARGVIQADGAEAGYDAVIFATGFRPNLDYLRPLGALDEHGSALHQEGISTVVEGLGYVGISGQRSFASATLRGVGDDAAYVVKQLKRLLPPVGKSSRAPCCFRPCTAA